jgi:putative chitinase
MVTGFCCTASAEALLRRYGLADETQLAVLLSSELFQGKTEHDVCNLVANLAHETGNFRYTREIADGERYNGRLDLGNTEPGDGPRFKGRGLIQLTGRYNYVMFQKYLVEAGGDLAALDIVSDPELLANDPRLCALTVVFFLRNKWTSGMSVMTLRRRINGGLNGLGDTLTKYLDALADDDARRIAIEREKAEYEQEALLAKRGQRDFSYRIGDAEYRFERVADLQRRLGVEPVDGIFGDDTEAAIRAFQQRRGLVEDGKVGPTTWAALANDNCQ